MFRKGWEEVAGWEILLEYPLNALARIRDFPLSVDERALWAIPMEMKAFVWAIGEWIATQGTLEAAAEVRLLPGQGNLLAGVIRGARAQLTCKDDLDLVHRLFREIVAVIRKVGALEVFRAGLSDNDHDLVDWEKMEVKLPWVVPAEDAAASAGRES